MARPKKTGLDYFPLDVDIFDDPKVLFIQDKFDSKGELITIKLLCWIFRNGYYCEWNEDHAFIFAKKHFSNIKANLIIDVVNELVKRGFFNEEIFSRFGILTSKGIQHRWLSAIEQSKRSAIIKPEYNLLEKEFLPNFKEETTVKREESTQRKENKKKEKENKKNTKKNPESDISKLDLQTLSSNKNIRDNWYKWLNYKKDQFSFEYKTESSETVAYKDFIKKSSNNPNLAEKVVNQAIAGGWKGLYELKQNNNGNSKNTENQRLSSLAEYRKRKQQAVESTKSK